jgi:hypothetical protein
MSILVEGLAAHSVSHSSIPRSVLSVGFHARLPTRPGTLQLLITTSTGAHHPISFPLAFTVSAHASSDVELGLDWTVFLRDSLIGLGYRVDSTFDAWRFLTAPTHPVTTRMYLHCFNCCQITFILSPFHGTTATNIMLLSSRQSSHCGSHGGR